MTVLKFIEVPPIAGDSKVTLPPEEWRACVELWITLADFHLKLREREWNKSLENDSTKTLKFLLSYFRALSNPERPPELSDEPRARELRRLSFLLNHRVLSTVGVESIPIDVQYLISVCAVFPKSEELRKLLLRFWKRKTVAMDEQLNHFKSDLLKILHDRQMKRAEMSFTRAVPLLHLMPDIGAFLFTGSDLLDSINDGYRLAEDGLRKSATLIVYLGFLGLLTCSEPNLSVFSDQLYSLKASSKPNESSFLSDLASDTPIIPKIQELVAPQDAPRARKLEQLLSEYRKPGTSRPKHLVRRKIVKDKGKAKDESTRGTFGHVHLMSLISQVQDLFPDLGSAFIAKLLDEYNEDVEQVTAHLLDSSLPPHLQSLSRTENLPNLHTPSPSSTDLAPHLVPRASPPPERRNIYDNDELDALTVSTSRLRLGRADNDEAIRATAPNKAAILSALAAFDSDDDERDDTYDIEDVGGAVEAGNEEDDADKNEEVLYNAYRASPDTFARDAGTRRGRARAVLKSETGMTDEAVEGWGVMVARDPRRLRRLEGKYASFGGGQSVVARTAYREGGGEESEEGGHASDRRRGGRVRGERGGRGRGVGKGGSGSGVAGPANEAGTQKARQGKEANKGSRANHNRRDQRARKIARAGFPG